ncbi:hypothetical protein, partial [Microcoleus sp. LEGE 07076]|uniref:hypothetical protein n=1 Tax=Microcoleus sp. LEGE 07076 TaxID=915322 RepID=UPI001D143668
ISARCELTRTSLQEASGDELIPFSMFAMGILNLRFSMNIMFGLLPTVAFFSAGINKIIEVERER